MQEKLQDSTRPAVLAGNILQDVTDHSRQPAARDAAAQGKQKAERRPEPSSEDGNEKALNCFGHTPDDGGGSSLQPDSGGVAEPPKATAIEEKEDKKGGEG